MKNDVVSPRFEEKNYKGQDVVHYGISIPLQVAPMMYSPTNILEMFSRRAQRIIQKRIPIEFRKMTDADLPVLRKLWFDENDVTFPNEMGNEHIGIVGTKANGEVMGGVIWSYARKDQLFLHQLISGDDGKRIGLPTLLIWESVKRYSYSDIKYLDIGVSYNPKRYEFFCNFAVEKYPIILKKPFYVPVIRFSPFRSFESMNKKVAKLRDDQTFLPRGSYAIYAALKHIGIKEGDQVVIVKTFEGKFISGCVTSTIEKTGASWRLRGWDSEDKAKALVVIHEFGVPVYRKQDLDFIEWAKRNNVPIIEDCAWRLDSVMGKQSTYRVYSMQKMCNMNYGGLLSGVKLDNDFLWKIGCYDFVKEKMMYEEIDVKDHDKRIELWRAFHVLVIGSGMKPFDTCGYADGKIKWLPTVYMLDVENEIDAKALVDRLEEFGIQAGRYWGTNAIYVPIHQNMSKAEVEYMFAVIRGYYNLCRDYGKVAA